MTSTTEADRRQLTRIARNCWVPTEHAADLAARCAAALSTSAACTAAVLMTAGRLHDFWLPEGPDEPLHLATAAPITAGRRMTRTRRPEFRAHRRQLPDGDLVTINGVVVTSPARTWRDLAQVLHLPDLVAAGDSALRSGTTLDELTQVVSRTGRERFVCRARSALVLLDARSRSRAESHLRVAVSAPDLPAFGVNEAVSRRDGGWLAEPDLSLPAARIALEYQGADHAELGRMRRDMTRATDLRRDGWLVHLYGPAEVFGRPWEIATEVRAAIARRAPQLLARPHRRVVTYGPSGQL